MVPTCDIGYPVGYEMYKNEMSFNEKFKPPGVEVHCLYGRGVSTIKTCMYYDETRADEVTDVETKSILKPPKVRAPLQEVDFIGVETDPDVIRKRRVSFAGVKIKEFNSKAESLIICSTPAYEETFSTSSDSSALTASGIENSSSVECLIDCTIMNDTMDLTDLSCKEDADNNMDITNLPKTGSSSKDSCKKSAATILSNEIPGRQPADLKLFGDECSDHVPLPATQLPPALDPTKLLVNALLENSNTIEDTSLIQENIPLFGPLAKDVSPRSLFSEKHIVNNLFMPQSESENKKALESDSLSKNQHTPIFSVPKSENVLETSMANQTGMEFTTAIPQNCPFPKGTDSLSQIEFTEAVPSKVAQERLVQVEPVRTACEENMSSSGMDFTEAIPKFNEECRFHFNVENTNITHRGHAVNSKPGPASIMDATLSMDFTEVLKPRKSFFLEEPNKENVRPLSGSYCEGNSEIESSVMEFTEAVILPKSNNVWNYNNENPVASLMNSFIGLGHEKQPDFHTSQMEFTEAIPNKLRNELFFNCKNILQNSLVNESFNMEITEAIPQHLRVKKSVENMGTYKQISNENINEDAKLTRKVNCLMELRAGVSSEDNNRAPSNKNHLGENTPTILEQNKSVPKNNNGFRQQTIEPTSAKDVESVGYNSTLMEFTEAVPKGLNIKNGNVVLCNNTKEDVKPLSNLHSTMELTAALGSIENNKQSGYERGMFFPTLFEQNKPDSKTGNDFLRQTAVHAVSEDENIGNNSTLMEFTEAIPKCQNVQSDMRSCNKNTKDDMKSMANFQSTMELTGTLNSKESNKPSDHANVLGLHAPSIFGENKPDPINDNRFVRQPGLHAISEDECVGNNSTLMEFTEAFPKSMNIKHDNIDWYNKNTKEDVKSMVNFHSTMELTAATLKESNKPSDHANVLGSHAPIIFEKNKPDPMNDNNFVQQPGVHATSEDECVGNNSTLMEFTEAIPKSMNIKHDNIDWCNKNTKEDVKSMVNFHSTMELTAALAKENNKQSGQEYGTVFEQIKPYSRTDNGFMQHPAVLRIAEDESVGNNSTMMEFTEAIPKCLIAKSDTEKIDLCDRNTKEDAKSTVNVHSAMELTAGLIAKENVQSNAIDQFDFHGPTSDHLNPSKVPNKDFDTEIVPQFNKNSKMKHVNQFSFSNTIGFTDMIEGYSLPQVEVDDIPRLPPEVDRTQKFEQKKDHPGIPYEVDFTDMLPLNRETHMPNLQKKLVFSMPERGDNCDFSQIDMVERVSSNKPAPSGWNTVEEMELESSLRKEATPKPKKLPRFSTANFIRGDSDSMDESKLEQSVKAKILFPEIIPEGKNLLGTPPIDNSLKYEHEENQSDIYIIEQTCNPIDIDQGQAQQIVSDVSKFSENQADDLSQVELHKNCSPQEDMPMPFDNVVGAFSNEKKNTEPNIESYEVPIVKMNLSTDNLFHSKHEVKITNQEVTQPTIVPEEISKDKQESEKQFKDPSDDIVSRLKEENTNKINPVLHSKEDLKRMKKIYEKEQWENLMKNRSFFNEINFFSMGPYLWKYSLPWPLEIAVRISKQVVTFKSENIIQIELRSTLRETDLIGSLIDFCMKKNLNLILSEDWLNSNCKNIQTLLIAIKIIEDEYESLRPFFSGLKSVSLEAPWTFKNNCIHFNLVSLKKMYHILIKINISNIKNITGNDVEVVNYIKGIRQEEVQKVFDKCEPSKERFHNFIKDVEARLSAS